jgi:pyruvate carboxylase subunit B
MPGLVVRVEVAVGQQVEAGAGLVVVEAMKMENELRAPRAGVVAAVLVTVGQAVDKGAPLVTVESPEPSG